MVAGPKSEDAELAETLRRDDPEQFVTLVRMHLSFVLDLNTDECDGAVEKSGKFRPMKWSFTPFAKKTKPVNRPTADAVSLTQEIISQVNRLIQWLRQEQNLVQEGIFRRSGKMTRQQELKTLLTTGCPLKLEEGQFSVHDCASVLKNFLAQLPEPLLTEAHFPAHCQIAELCSGKGDVVEEERLLKAIQLILLLLPSENLQLLKDLIGLLHLTSTYDHVNKMSADNLATLFTPHLLCPRKLTPEALHTNSQTMSGEVSFMIKQGPVIFQIPVQLATDIRAYWSTRENRALMPKRELNESTCDGMAAKTVFTFVDRERTAEASASTNPTEAALAQLYAHIQSLPESSKKRKLIKQFNKENGQGTPQLIVGSHGNNRTSRSRHRNIGPNKPRQRSRSLGESIKKHIPGFYRGAKDPKKLSDEFYIKEPFDSPCSSPVSKVKNFFQKSATEGELSNSLQSPMPTFKKSLVADVDDEAKSLRLRLTANAKRTPVLVAPGNSAIDKEDCGSTSSNDSNSAGDEHFRNTLKRSTSSISHADKNSDSKESGPTKSPRLEPNYPLSVPPSSSVESLAASPDVKHPPGTCRDDSWPVSTASASAMLPASSCGNLSSVGLPNASLLTPRNVLAWMTSTPAYARACLQADSPLSNCLLTPSNANGNNSMSPITRSTQKMPKAMQEDMMTPRSRKPVVALSSSNLSQLAHLGGWGRSGSGELRRDATSRATLLSDAGASLNCKILMKEENFIEQEADDDPSVHIPIEKMLAKEVPRDVTVKEEEVARPENRMVYGTDGCECCSEEKCVTCRAGNGSLDYYSCSSEGSGALTGTFREIVLSRSVLTASPVDLSFSSHTGDFDTSSDREVRYVLNNDNDLSESLLYCLDGNEPSCLNRSNVSHSDPEKKLHTSSEQVSSVSEKEPVDLDYESSGVLADEEMNDSCSLDSPVVRVDVSQTNDDVSVVKKTQCEAQDSSAVERMGSKLSFNSDLNLHDTCVQSEIERCLTESTTVSGCIKETTF